MIRQAEKGSGRPFCGVAQISGLHDSTGEIFDDKFSPGRTMPGRAVCLVPRRYFEKELFGRLVFEIPRRWFWKGSRLKKPCNDRPLFDPPEMLNAPLTKLYLQAPRLTFHSVGKTMLVMTCCWYRQIAFVQLYNWTRPCSVFSSEDQARCISHDLIDHSISL